MRDLVSKERVTVEKYIERSWIEEVESGLEIMKNGKTSGTDDIILECLKNAEEQLIEQPNLA